MTTTSNPATIPTRTNSTLSSSTPCHPMSSRRRSPISPHAAHAAPSSISPNRPFLKCPRTRSPVPAHMPFFSRWMLAFPAAAALACLIFLTIHFRNTAISTNPVAAVDPRYSSRLLRRPRQHRQPNQSPRQRPPPRKSRSRNPIPVPRTSRFGRSALRSRRKPPRSSPASQPRLRRTPQTGNGNSSARSNGQETRRGSHVRYWLCFDSYGVRRRRRAARSRQPHRHKPHSSRDAGRREDEARRELHSAANQYDLPRAQAQQAQASAPAPPASPNSGIYGGTGQANLNQNYSSRHRVPAAPLVTEPHPPDDATGDRCTRASPRSPLRAKRRLTLPSKLAALSVTRAPRASRRHRRRAVPQRRRRRNLAASASPVDRPRLKVALVPSTNGHLLSKSLGGISAAKSSAPSPTFELTTDAGDLWISPDGQTWKHK